MPKPHETDPVKEVANTVLGCGTAVWAVAFLLAPATVTIMIIAFLFGGGC